MTRNPLHPPFHAPLASEPASQRASEPAGPGKSLAAWVTAVLSLALCAAVAGRNRIVLRQTPALP
ncbi:hypothetical protein HNP48_003709 [Acidovorax soli]|uniref:Uncharacterized protein n=1 Tax=Acidovorax soli TaxID=592050 RepID=A0A7X0PGG6_9BURK|nr:hypothetical protein [Acidovorax soli]